jgi:hypothetical protein
VKLFPGNEAPNQVLTFPFGNDESCSEVQNSVLVSSTNADLVKIIAILLLGIKDVPSRL